MYVLDPTYIHLTMTLIHVAGGLPNCLRHIWQLFAMWSAAHSGGLITLSSILPGLITLHVGADGQLEYGG